MDATDSGGLDEYALYYGLGGAIGLFTIILIILCGCLCYIRCCRPRPAARPKPVANGTPVSFTGNFESRDSIVEDHIGSTGVNHIYEDLDTIRLEKNKLEEKEKANANPENGEKEPQVIGNGHATIITVDDNTVTRNGNVHVSNGMPNGTISNDGVATVIVTNGSLPNGGVSNGGVPNGGVTIAVEPNGGVPNGGAPNERMPNGGVANGGLSNGGILTNQNVSAAVFTAQVPGSYQNRSQTLPSGSRSRSADDEPIYARHSKTSKKKHNKKTPPKVKFNVPHGLGPGDTLPKGPTSPKTPDLPPKKTDVMY